MSLIDPIQAAPRSLSLEAEFEGHISKEPQPVHIVDVENGPSYLFSGSRLVASGSREMCEAVRDGKIQDYIARSDEERRRLKIGLYSPRVQRQLALEAAAARPVKEQADLFA
jgi:hypothetical protein